MTSGNAEVIPQQPADEGELEDGLSDDDSDSGTTPLWLFSLEVLSKGNILAWHINCASFYT